MITTFSNNQRLGSVFNVTKLSLLCQVGDDVIRPTKYAGMPNTHPKIQSFHQPCPVQSQLQSVLGVHSFYIKCNSAVTGEWMK